MINSLTGVNQALPATGLLYVWRSLDFSWQFGSASFSQVCHGSHTGLRSGARILSFASHLPTRQGWAGSGQAEDVRLTAELRALGGGGLAGLEGRRL